MVLGDGPLSQVTFVTCSNQSKTDSTKPGARDEEARCTEGKIHIKISRLETFYANLQCLKRAGKPGNRQLARNSSFPDWENNSCNLGRHAARLRSNLYSLVIGPGMQGRDAAERVRDFVWR